MEDKKTNIEGGIDSEKWNDFSIIRDNNYLMLCYKGVTIPFQTGMSLTNDLDQRGFIHVEVKINCFVKIENLH